MGKDKFAIVICFDF